MSPQELKLSVKSENMKHIVKVDVNLTHIRAAGSSMMNDFKCGCYLYLCLNTQALHSFCLCNVWAAWRESSNRSMSSLCNQT